jgi:photosystem II stability/assembly factor-like uncharacterized protein
VASPFCQTDSASITEFPPYLFVFRSLAYNVLLVRGLTALVLAIAAAPAPPGAHWEPQISGVSARLRGVSAVSTTVAWASGASGTLLRTVDGGGRWELRPIAGTAALDFRDVDGFSERIAYALSIGPGESSRIYKTMDGGEHWELQFANQDPKVFLDSMAFWDAGRGVAFSDSADGRFVVFTTTNGRTWTRVPADRLPAALDREGAFAASGTNVAVSSGNRVWIGTTAGRVLRSIDGGRTWSIATTPIHTGKSAGIFSIAFRNASEGVAVGGDFNKPDEAVANAAVTSDGGSTWILGKGLRGYRSVIAWSRSGRGPAIAVGPTGADASVDGGRTWTPLDADGFDTLSFAPGASTGWAAGDNGRIAKLTIRE